MSALLQPLGAGLGVAPDVAALPDVRRVLDALGLNDAVFDAVDGEEGVGEITWSGDRWRFRLARDGAVTTATATAASVRLPGRDPVGTDGALSVIADATRVTEAKVVAKFSVNGAPWGATATVPATTDGLLWTLVPPTALAFAALRKMFDVKTRIPGWLPAVDDRPVRSLRVYPASGLAVTVILDPPAALAGLGEAVTLVDVALALDLGVTASMGLVATLPTTPPVPVAVAFGADGVFVSIAVDPDDPVRLGDLLAALGVGGTGVVHDILARLDAVTVEELSLSRPTGGALAWSLRFACAGPVSLGPVQVSAASFAVSSDTDGLTLSAGGTVSAGESSLSMLISYAAGTWSLLQPPGSTSRLSPSDLGALIGASMDWLPSGTIDVNRLSIVADGAGPRSFELDLEIDGWVLNESPRVSLDSCVIAVSGRNVNGWAFEGSGGVQVTVAEMRGFGSIRFGADGPTFEAGVRGHVKSLVEAFGLAVPDGGWDAELDVKFRATPKTGAFAIEASLDATSALIDAPFTLALTHSELQITRAGAGKRIGVAVKAVGRVVVDGVLTVVGEVDVTVPETGPKTFVFRAKVDAPITFSLPNDGGVVTCGIADVVITSDGPSLRVEAYALATGLPHGLAAAWPVDGLFVTLTASSSGVGLSLTKPASFYDGATLLATVRTAEVVFGADPRAVLSFDAPEGALRVGRLLAALGVDAELPYDPSLTRADLALLPGGRHFSLKVGDLDALVLERPPREGVVGFRAVGIGFRGSFDLTQVPVVGEWMPGADVLGVKRVAVRWASAEITAADALSVAGAVPESLAGAWSAGVSASATLMILGDPMVLPPVPAPGAPPVPAAPGATAPVGKNIGPLRIDRLGVSVADGDIVATVDGGFNLGPVALSVVGLRVSNPMNGFEPDFTLDGLAVAMNTPQVSLGGAFLRDRTAPANERRWGGGVIVGAGQYLFSAIGAYSEREGEPPSFFVFANVDANIGGPVYARIKGFMGGFGVNSALRVPGIDDAERFPLLGGGQGPPPSQVTMLSRLFGEKWLTTETGAHWAAIGIRLSHFEVAETRALAVVTFGNRLVIALLGRTTLTLPPQKPGLPPIRLLADLELDVIAKIVPDEGTFLFAGRFSSRSWVLDPRCHVTGGFAIAAWFSGEHAGDFVITVGGYHPSVSVAHYPAVPRLGLAWAIGGGVHVKGDAYFAITPAMAMAGGSLEVAYEAGKLRAWFTARADFLFQFHPLAYQGRIAVRLGASLRIQVWFVHKTVSIEVGATLSVRGPPFHGALEIDFWLFEFTVRFGDAGAPEPRVIRDWSEFRSAYLPADAEGGLLRWRIVAGERPGHGGVDATETRTPVVDPERLRLRVTSAVPITDTWAVGGQSGPGVAVGVRPMRRDRLSSSLTVVVGRELEDGRFEDVNARFEATAIVEPVPVAAWGDPSVGARRTVPGLVAVELRPRSHDGEGLVAFGPFDPDRDEFRIDRGPVMLAPPPAPAAPAPDDLAGVFGSYGFTVPSAAKSSARLRARPMSLDLFGGER